MVLRVKWNKVENASDQTVVVPLSGYITLVMLFYFSEYPIPSVENLGIN